MTAEKKRIPEWARKGRENDLTWIQENLDIFNIAATIGHKDFGRGVIVVDTSLQSVEGMGHPFGYFSMEQIEDYDDEETKHIVRKYNLEQEFVLVLLKPGDRTSTYRICIQRRKSAGG